MPMLRGLLAELRSWVFEDLNASREHQLSKQGGQNHLQKSCVFAFLYALLDQLQGLFQILPVNGILNLVVAPEEHGVVRGRHCDELLLELDSIHSANSVFYILC